MTISTETAILAAEKAKAETSRFLRRRPAGDYLKSKYGFGAGSSLAKIACISSDGPPFRKVGRMVLYAIEDLDRWATAKIGAPRKSTSEASSGKRPPSAEQHAKAP